MGKLRILFTENIGFRYLKIYHSMKKRAYKRALPGLLLIVLLSSLHGRLEAQWSTDPNINTAVVTDSYQQNSCKVVSDGSGGAIIVWWDYNVSLGNDDYNIYAQRINAQGVIQWDARGVPICTNPAMQHVPHVASDGQGGALIAWFDKRNIKNEVFAQRIGPDGVVKWAADGVSVGTAADHHQQGSPEITSDGGGGAIIAFDDWRNTFENPVRFISAQRISASGSIMWPAGGVDLNGTSAGESPRIAGDGNGGAIICWFQYTGDPLTTGNRDIFAQKVDGSGAILWGLNAMPICTQTSHQYYPELTSDGNGGAIISWQDYRNGSYGTIYAQKVNSSGAAQWTANGVRITTSTTTQMNQKLLPDDAGGAFITWQVGNGWVSAQHMSSSGTKLWLVDEGVSTCNYCDSRNPEMVSDMAGGVIIAWNDSQSNIYAQRISSAGETLWWPNTSFWKAYISVAGGEQNSPVITTDGYGGAIIAWDDRRNYLTNGYNTDIYAQQIAQDKSLAVVTAAEKINDGMEPGGDLDQNYPNPFSSSTTITYRVSIAGSVRLTLFDISGREVAVLVNSKMDPGEYSLKLDGTKLPGGVYYYRLASARGSSILSMMLLK
jgi:hypothetical protein